MGEDPFSEYRCPVDGWGWEGFEDRTLLWLCLDPCTDPWWEPDASFLASGFGGWGKRVGQGASKISSVYVAPTLSQASHITSLEPHNSNDQTGGKVTRETKKLVDSHTARKWQSWVQIKDG